MIFSIILVWAVTAESTTACFSAHPQDLDAAAWMHLPWHKKGSKAGASGSSTPVSSPGWASPGSIFSIGGGLASSDSSYDRPPEFDIEYANEDHLKVFERALNANEDAEEPQVEHIRSVSDFAPIRERVKTASKKRRDVVREGWAYHVSRWPLLVGQMMLLNVQCSLSHVTY